ncbi:Tissue alpha-L-fucosidase [Seminavis robusta]|uniref:alpha-L-fucosidase n=1 Tax=Seminavis robusta TaxID=568900 RepID=A0A9N8H9P4_9STRA|nr:Tissue alpha-L-fucosidase [Seminavis robusta]|eukprot:Sro198_g084260.1 Tissue alpha-L-fucosidase (218) ;mRNA; f:92712-93673
MVIRSLLISALLLACKAPWRTAAWDPTWESLDSRPLPAWYDEAKFGIFIHWGVFSVPAFDTAEWFWWVWKGGYDGPVKPSFQKFVEESEVKNFAYQDYAHRFTAQLWNPDEWAKIFKRAGAQYVVLTSKHHEGFCNWDSRNLHHTWNWNAMDVGPRRDLVGDLAKAVKNTTSAHTNQKLHFGLYHSLFEWFNPLYIEDMKNNFTTHNFAKHKLLYFA